MFYCSLTTGEVLMMFVLLQGQVGCWETVVPSTSSVVTGGPAASWATPAVPTPPPTLAPAAVTSTT